jgi:hypothetical protein
MDRAAPGNKTIVDGWLNRYPVSPAGQLIAGISLSNASSKQLAGAAPQVAFESTASFADRELGDGASRRARRPLRAHRGTPLGQKVIDVRDIDLVDAVDTTTSVVIPPAELAAALATPRRSSRETSGVRA